MTSEPSIRIAVDIGGTFTDLVLHEDDRLVAIAKTLTTYPDPSLGVTTGLHQLLENWPRERVREVVHGTTLVSNALIERKGSVTALLTTEGFRDVLTSGKEQRYDMYDLFLEMPVPLVPRRRRYGIRERVLADGSIDIALDVDQVKALVPTLAEAGVEAVAISYLHSYRQPAHEEATADILRQGLPGVVISLSSDVSPEVGEYHRTSTTVANAYVLPVVDRYLERLEAGLRDKDISAPLNIMLSNGGLATSQTARRYPVRLLESGPAAGVLAAGVFGSQSGKRDVLAFDMGGTTAKAGLIKGGIPLLAREHEAARVYRFTKGSGMPIRVPVIDLIEIGAGGGSIARVGPFGLPKVGPESAASDPGPACYKRGGTDPTVTDADLVLGYLNPDFFLGGEMKLDIEAAELALSVLAHKLGLSLLDTASAVHRVVNENMASAARMHAIERGRDIRAFTLVATGGAGPVHAWGVARSLGITQLAFPPKAGVASAFGMLTAPPSFEFARSLPSMVSRIDWGDVKAALEQMVTAGHRELANIGASPDQISVVVAADLRYQGQGDAVTVDLTGDAESLDNTVIGQRFYDEYIRLFGSTPPEVEAEVLTWRVRVTGPSRHQTVSAFEPGTGDAGKGTRQMWFAEVNAMIEAAVYSRYALSPGTTIEGPAAIEERESTVVIGPGGLVHVAESGNLEIAVDA